MSESRQWLCNQDQRSEISGMIGFQVREFFVLKLAFFEYEMTLNLYTPRANSFLLVSEPSLQDKIGLWNLGTFEIG
jgi:hypothetical protein